MEIQDGKTFKLLPPAPGKCPICADAAHGAELPHNRDSLFYQIHFANENGRSPTWADAAADCSDLTRRELRQFLTANRVSLEKIGDL
jgi:hypothetical protein